MNVGYISSDEYSPLLLSSITSLLDNNKEVDQISIYIIDDDISEKNKKRLSHIISKYQRNISFIDKETVSKYVEENNFTSFRKSNATYAKILTDILFKDLDRILMIDCDTIVNRSLSKIYSIDFDDKLVAAVPELTAKYYSSEDPQILSRKKFYYNTGFLLWNLKKCREVNFSELTVKAMKQYGKNLHLADQSLLNLTLDDDDILPISYIYNYSVYLHIMNNLRKKVQYEYETLGLGCGNTDYSKKIRESEIAVIHYLGDRRPWIKGKHAPLSRPYLKYSKMCGNKYSISYYDIIIAKKIRKSPHSIFSNKILGAIYSYYISIKEYRRLIRG